MAPPDDMVRTDRAPGEGACICSCSPALETFALRVLSALDDGLEETLWSFASQVARRHIHPGHFSAAIRNERAHLGQARARQVAGYRQSSERLDSVTPGCLVDVRFRTQFDALVASEVVTLRYEEDRVWRLSGYAFAVD